MRKIKLLIAILIICFTASAQDATSYNSWNFAGGITGTPGHMVKVGYDVSPTNNLSYYFEAAGEWSNYNKMRYSSYSLSLGPRFYLIGGNDLSNPKKINLLAGITGILQYENETTLYKGLAFTKHLNYGAGAHLLAEYIYDPTIGIMGGFEQRLLFNKDLGKSNYNFFMGLRIHFGNN